MIDGKTICVVVPAYNEEGQILHVIDTMPDFVDRIVVVNDRSKDATLDVLKNRLATIDGVELKKQEVYNGSKTTLDYDRADRVLQELLTEQSQNHIRRDVI